MTVGCFFFYFHQSAFFSVLVLQCVVKSLCNKLQIFSSMVCFVNSFLQCVRSWIFCGNIKNPTVPESRSPKAWRTPPATSGSSGLSPRQRLQHLFWAWVGFFGTLWVNSLWACVLLWFLCFFCLLSRPTWCLISTLTPEKTILRASHSVPGSKRVLGSLPGPSLWGWLSRCGKPLS